MNIQTQIEEYLNSLSDNKQKDIQMLHQRLLLLLPNAKLWFDCGFDEQGRTICNPTIGYGQFIIHYANGTSKPFFQIGISANTAGISVYILGLKDKNYLKDTFSNSIGKAKITCYCIKFKKLDDINISILEAAIQYAVYNHDNIN